MSECVIETQRLCLRRLTRADRPALAGLDWLDTDRVLERCLADYQRYGHAFWAVVIRDTGAFAGVCGLLVQEVEGTIEHEVGYHLLPDFHRQGIASEAARAVMDYAFAELGRRRVISIIMPDNAASIGVARKNGLRYERPAKFKSHDVGIYVAVAGDDASGNSG